jgi:hypothetical protein
MMTETVFHCQRDQNRPVDRLIDKGGDNESTAVLVHSLRAHIFVTSLGESDVAVGVYDEEELLTRMGNMQKQQSAQ